MKAWDKKTPIMSSAKVMIASRGKLWDYLKNNPGLSSNRVDRVIALIRELNRQINRRAMDPDKVRELLQDVKRYSRNYKRIGKKRKLSRRAVKFVLKQTARRNG
jgi:hypothetical protein